MPVTYEAGGIIPREAYSGLKELLFKWVENSIGVVTSEAMFQKGYVEKQAMGQIVRALGFALGLALPRSSDPGLIYFRCHDAFSALAIHRYSSLVLLPTATKLAEQGLKDKRHRSYLMFLTSVETALEKWVSYATERLPQVLQVWQSLVYGRFLTDIAYRNLPAFSPPTTSQGET